MDGTVTGGRLVRFERTTAPLEVLADLLLGLATATVEDSRASQSKACWTNCGAVGFAIAAISSSRDFLIA